MLKTILVGLGVIALGAAAGAAAATYYLEKHPVKTTVAMVAPMPKKPTVQENKDEQNKSKTRKK